MQLCGFELKRGEKRQVTLAVPAGEGIDATLICGATAGKTLVVTAGVHGCEYIGVEAVRSLARELDPQTLSGQVVLVPLMNAAGFYQGAKQVVPQDGINLNRAFPGDAAGTLSSRIASMAETLLYPYAHLLVDLHGGDINEMAMPFVYFPAAASPAVTAAALAAAQAMSLPYRVASTAKNGLYSWAAQCGIPALLLERGGAGRWSTDEVEAYRENIYELLHHLAILPQTFPAYTQTAISKSVYLEAPSNGLWYPNVKEGQTFEKGAHLGTLRDSGGNVLEEYHAQFDGVTLYYTLSLGVQTDDPLIAYGAI